MNQTISAKDINWRYEVKYLLTASQWEYLRLIISSHPAAFTPLFPDRFINNIYYDTPDFEMCRDNIAGIADRRKYRLRWYGNNPIIKPILEIKIKSNSLGYKKNYPYTAEIQIDQINKWVNQTIIKSGQLNPVIYNQYLRSYFISADNKFRLTVDRHISYKSIADFSNDRIGSSVHDDRIVLEIKFNKADDNRLSNISSFIPFHPAKHSKYVTGILGMY